MELPPWGLIDSVSVDDTFTLIYSVFSSVKLTNIFVKIAVTVQLVVHSPHDISNSIFPEHLF